VFIRDRFACVVPRCTSKRFLEVHHVKRRADGGGHEPWNLMVLSDCHHKQHHEGVISIRGRAPDQLVFETPLSPARD
jgi:5-methylcytosine-specific restriction endonuclease McrA